MFTLKRFLAFIAAGLILIAARFYPQKPTVVRKLAVSLPPSDEGGGFCLRQKPEGEKCACKKAPGIFLQIPGVLL